MSFENRLWVLIHFFTYSYISGSGVRSPFSENIPMFTAWCLLVVT